MSGLITLGLIYLLVVFFIGGSLFVVYAVVTYNRFVRLKTQVESTLSDVDVLLTKRYNLVPNLVETIRGYAGHESGVFEEVTARRSTAMQATTVEEKGRQEGLLGEAFKSLFAVVESYPTLKADANFQQLQNSLQELEAQIEAARRHYNASVREHNILLKSFPANIIGKVFGLSSQVFFESQDNAERQTPKVGF